MRRHVSQGGGVDRDVPLPDTGAATMLAVLASVVHGQDTHLVLQA